jgi:hypothetical protein
MFLFHGGSCPATTTKAAAFCQDFHGGPPAIKGQVAFIVLTDVKDPTKTFRMWATVGDYFWTKYQDYPIGDIGLSDAQNITIYSSQQTTFDNMLQTMIYYAPCEGPEGYLEQLDSTDDSVQLVGTALDPSIRAIFKVQISSRTNKKWQLQQATVATSADPAFQALDVSKVNVIGSSARETASLPIRVTMDKTHELAILSTATAVTATGLVCKVHGLYDSSIPTVS